MKNTSTTKAFKAFYEHYLSGDQHNNPGLIGKWGADPGRFETQIMCHKMGNKIPDSSKFEQDGEIFGPVRWPYDAKGVYGEPHYSDPPIQFIPAKRVKAIGTTWWDWKNQRSIGLGFDFDSLIDHAAGIGVSKAEIDKIDNIDVPWLEVIRSTRGNGRHVYIWFDESNAPATANHDEHSALARAFIPLIAEHTKLDIDSNVDCTGMVMWVHHVNATKENQGYTLVKPATQILTADHVPPNWRDNLEVVSGSRTKVRVQGWTADGTPTKGDELDEMTQAHAKVPLDEVHLRILDDLEGTGHTSLWVHDHHLWQGHTAGLKTVYDEWAEKGHPMRGLFDTDSMDTDPGKPNCLCADTKVITRQGVKPISELAGRNVEIITARGKWTEAPFKSYGEQEVFAVTIANRSQSKVIKATGDHRWYVTKYRSDGYRKTRVNFGEREQVETKDLTEGRILVQTKPRCDHTPSVVGIQHGLVWGDGTNGGQRTTSDLPLFGEKDAQLLKYFAEHPQRPIDRSVGGVEVWNLPHHFKSLVPLHYDKAYLYGWLAGYFAADGCVSDTGSCIVRSTDKQSIEHVRQVCHILGVETSKITTGTSSGFSRSTVYTTILKAADLSEEFFLIEQHRERWASTTNRQHHYWRVVSVEPAGREEVFCCTVPETYCFVLEDFILIGNCFMRPKPDGAWDVYRFGEGTGEHPLWDTQGKWTHTTYNYPATLKQICLASGGYEGTDEKQGYLFDDQASLQVALQLLGSKLQLPPRADGRQLSLHADNFDKIVLVIAKERGDDKKDFPRYVKTSRGWEKWIQDAIQTSDAEQTDQELWSKLDNEIRCLKVAGVNGNAFDSWVMKDETGEWVIHPKDNLKDYLLSEGYNKPGAIVGGAIFKSWAVVNEPFKPEYPGGRMWNKNSPQFVYAPVELKEGESPSHPTWSRVMEHCGCDLNDYIPDLPWCKEWGILTGGDYLTAWVACMFQNPYGKLPYLFMYGPQNSGKSSFHEAIEFLLTRGVVKADRALTSEQGYNGELMEAVLAVIDEVDISRAGMSVYNKIKEWVTGTTISIHAKYKQVQEIRNTLHFVQMSNSRSALPVLPGDTRITVMNVPCLEEEIPRDRLHELLKQEAPNFMRTLLDYEIPDPSGRLMLPIIETQGKIDAADSNRNELEKFIEEHCHEVPGHAIKLATLKDKLHATLEEYQRGDWGLGYIKTVMNEKYLIGRSPRLNQTIVGNLTFNKDAVPCEPYVKKGVNIVKEGEE